MDEQTQKLLEWLRDDIQLLSTKVDNNHQANAAKFATLHRQLRTLQEFRWRIVGGSVAIAGVVAILFNLFMALKPN